MQNLAKSRLRPMSEAPTHRKTRSCCPPPTLGAPSPALPRRAPAGRRGTGPTPKNTISSRVAKTVSQNVRENLVIIYVINYSWPQNRMSCIFSSAPAEMVHGSSLSLPPSASGHTNAPHRAHHRRRNRSPRPCRSSR